MARYLRNLWVFAFVAISVRALSSCIGGAQPEPPTIAPKNPDFGNDSSGAPLDAAPSLCHRDAGVALGRCADAGVVDGG